jgi:hypothetical protein
VINGKDILALGWPAGKVIGLGLESASALKSRASPGTNYSLNCRTSGGTPAPRISARSGFTFAHQLFGLSALCLLKSCRLVVHDVVTRRLSETPAPTYSPLSGSL